MPSPFVLEYCCLVENQAALEVRVHGALSAIRYNVDREFFRTTSAEAVLAIAELAGEVEHSWTKPLPITTQVVRPRPPRVQCSGCEAWHVAAVHCPKCRLRLLW